MKPLLLFVLFTLAWVPWGEAGWFLMPCPSDETKQCRVINNVLEDPPTYTDHWWLGTAQRHQACVEIMEQAMRAMEPWLLSPKANRDKDGKETNTWDFGEWRKVRIQWEEAKACWRTP